MCPFRDLISVPWHWGHDPGESLWFLCSEAGETEQEPNKEPRGDGRGVACSLRAPPGGPRGEDHCPCLKGPSPSQANGQAPQTHTSHQQADPEPRASGRAGRLHSSLRNHDLRAHLRKLLCSSFTGQPPAGAAALASQLSSLPLGGCFLSLTHLVHGLPSAI